MEKLKFDFQYLAVCHTCKDVLGFYVKILLWKKQKKPNKYCGCWKTTLSITVSQTLGSPWGPH